VRRILINASKSRWRRRRAAEQPGGPPAEVPDPAADPATAVGERSALLAALSALPPRQRAVVVLRYWEDLTDAQTAALLGCSASTVRSQAARALAKLRASGALADTGADGEAPSRQSRTPPRQAGGQPVNLTGEQALRQRLREEFGALEISPAPVLRVTGRGREVRARRRAVAAATVVLAVLAVAAAAHFNEPAPRPPSR
jgi:DNA-binding CsgD family transcriptional regulator